MNNFSEEGLEESFNLLDSMVKDQKGQASVYNSGRYWERKSKATVYELNPPLPKGRGGFN